MPRPYITDSNDLTDTGPFTSRRLRDLADPAGFAVEGETGVVPASLRVFLDYVPREQSSFVLTVDGAARAAIPDGEPPAAGEVSVSLVTGALEFHASDEGESFSVDYVAAQSYHGAADLGALQSEIAAAQAAIHGNRVIVVGESPGAQYETLQAAVDAIPESRPYGPSDWWLIRVQRGIYVDMGHTSVNKPRVIICGESAESTEIWHESVGEDDPAPRAQQCTINILADDVTVANLTIHNASDEFPKKCVALGVGYTSDAVSVARARVRGCRITNGSGRDAVFISSETVTVTDCLINDCYIRGSSDIVSSFGGLTMDNCVIHCDRTTAHTGTFLAGVNTIRRCVFTGPTIMFNVVNDGQVVATDCHAPHPNSTVWVVMDATTIPKTLKLGNCTAGAPQLETGHPYLTVTTLPTPGTQRVSQHVAIGQEMLPPMEADGEVVADIISFGTTERALAFRAGLDGELNERRQIYPVSPYELHATHIRGVSHPDDDVTIESALAARVPKSTLTAKGSILTATAANTPAELAVGANGTVLVADSTAAGGVAWVQRGVVWQTLEDSATLNGSVSTEQDFSQTYEIPANALVAGSVWRIIMDGATKGNGTSETLTLKLYLGSTVILNTGARSTQNTNFGGGLRLPALFAVRSAGASGSICAMGDTGYLVYWYGNTALPATHTINTTGTLVIKASAQWSGTNTNNEAKLLSARLERLA